jgi:hypothetical protein
MFESEDPVAQSHLDSRAAVLQAMPGRPIQDNPVELLANSKERRFVFESPGHEPKLLAPACDALANHQMAADDSKPEVVISWSMKSSVKKNR